MAKELRAFGGPTSLRDPPLLAGLRALCGTTAPLPDSQSSPRFHSAPPASPLPARPYTLSPKPSLLPPRSRTPTPYRPQPASPPHLCNLLNLWIKREYNPCAGSASSAVRQHPSPALAITEDSQTSLERAGQEPTPLPHRPGSTRTHLKNTVGRVGSAEVSNARRDDEGVSRAIRRGGATRQAAPRRPNPSGRERLHRISSSLVVDVSPWTRLPPRSLICSQALRDATSSIFEMGSNQIARAYLAIAPKL